MRLLQSLVILNTLILVVLLFLVIELRSTIMTDVVKGISVPLHGIQSRIQAADDISQQVKDRFDQVGRALSAQSSPPTPAFEPVIGVISAEPTAAPSRPIDVQQGDAPLSHQKTLAPVKLSNVPPGISITMQEESSGIITFRGKADSTSVIATFLKQLSQSGEFSEVNLIESKQDNDGRKSFTFTAQRWGR